MKLSIQVRALLEKLQVSKAAKGEGHIHLFNTLLIGTKKYFRGTAHLINAIRQQAIARIESA